MDKATKLVKSASIGGFIGKGISGVKEVGNTAKNVFKSKDNNLGIKQNVVNGYNSMSGNGKRALKGLGVAGGLGASYMLGRSGDSAGRL